MAAAEEDLLTTAADEPLNNPSGDETGSDSAKDSLFLAHEFEQIIAELEETL